jgi:CHRD domain-containing protein
VNRRRLQLVLAIGVLSLLGVVGAAVATGGKDIRERLSGYEEVPAISSPASGEFKLRMNRFSDDIEWRLSYRGFDSNVTQAHIHFGDRHTNGGISVWLCANNPPITNAPAGTQACPLREGTISGVIEADDVVGPGRTATATGQGIEPGEFDEFVDALRAGVTYANVHTANFGGGEIRAQLEDDRDRDW